MSTGLWRRRAFLILWARQTASEVGSQVSLVAIPLTAVVALHATAFEAGLLGTFEYLPFILIGLPAGVWVDRMRRRPILTAADASRAVILGSIPVAAALHALTLLQLYAAGFLTGVMTVLFDVAYQSFLPALVEREQLMDGNAKLQFTTSTAQIVGPGLGGFLVELVTAPIAMAVDSVSYLLSVVSLLFVSAAETITPAHERGPWLAELKAGLRFVFGQPVLRSIAGCTATFNLFSSLTTAVVYLYAVRQLSMSPEAIGIWLGVGSCGAVLAAALVGRIASRLGVGHTILVVTWSTYWAYVLVALAPRSQPLPWLIASGLVMSFGAVAYNVTQVSLRQTITPDSMQGRMNASMRFVVWGTMPIGAFIGGVLGQVIGLHATIWVGAVGATSAALWVTFGPLRRVRTAADVAVTARLQAAPPESLGETRRLD